MMDGWMTLKPLLDTHSWCAPAADVHARYASKQPRLRPPRCMYTLRLIVSSSCFPHWPNAHSC